ncbi:MAG: porin family protein [Bacteroidales bacterium]
MKKIFALLFISFCFQVTAQKNSNDQFYVGINYGMGVSRMNADLTIEGILAVSTDYSFVSGYNGGLVFVYYSEPNRGIQLELNLTQRGWDEQPDSMNLYSRRINYIELPFLSHFDIGEKNTRFFIIGGPTLSYLISEKETMPYISSKKMTKDYYNTAIDNKLALDLTFGIGIARLTRFGNIQLDFRFSQGMSNLFSGNNARGLQATQNQFLGVKLSYLISLKRK